MTVFAYSAMPIQIFLNKVIAPLRPVRTALSVLEPPCEPGRCRVQGVVTIARGADTTTVRRSQLKTARPLLGSAGQTQVRCVRPDFYDI